MAKGNCEFRGTGGSYFVTVFVHMFLISLITLYIYSAWAWVRLLRLKASHTLINGKQVSFAGTGGELFGLVIVHFILLNIITVGLYTPWAVCRYFRWRAQNTLVDGKPSLFIGTGGSLFFFFLLHLLILPLLTLGLYYFYGIYRVYVWREEHTKYGGERTSFGARFGGFLGILLISWILNTFTFALFTPWSICMFYRWQVSGLAVGLRDVRHFPPVKANALLVIILVIIGLIPYAGAFYFYWPQLKYMFGPHLEKVENLTQLLKTEPKDQKDKQKVRQRVKGRVKRPAPRPIEKPEREKTPRKEPTALVTRKKPGKEKAVLAKSPQIPTKKPKQDFTEYDREIKELNDLIKQEKRNAKAFYNRGWLYAAKGDLSQAEKDYTEAVEIDKKLGGAYYNRGLVYVKMKKYALAIKDFTTAISLDRLAVDAYCNRGNANYELGKRNLAMRDYNRALKIRGDDADVLYNRGVVYLSWNEKEKAMADFEKAGRLGHEKAREHLKAEAEKQKKLEATSETASPTAWKKDLRRVKIPTAVASGLIHGEKFVSTSARIDHGILTIRDGRGLHPDHAVVIYLFPKKGETVEGKSFNVSTTSGAGSPHIHKKWKPKGEKVPRTWMFTSNYAMRLEFGTIKNGELPGKIYLCLPDKEKSYVAGSFRAIVK